MATSSLPPRLPLGVPLPGAHASSVAVAAPGAGAGFWAGGASAAVDADGTVWLAYRLRRPVGEGRGYAVVVASSADGVTFEPVLRLERDEFACDSLERPALVQRPDGGWRIYLSLATPGTLHWRVVALDADHPKAFDPRAVSTTLDAGPHIALKDPVVHPSPGEWRMWVCLHEVADPARADAMTTVAATSGDGLDWRLGDPALVPNGTAWDCRGTRVAAVIDVGGTTVAYYDGRASAVENWEERTGLAVADGDGMFRAVPGGPHAISAHASRSLRYVDVIAVPGGLRLYYEASRADGAHELRTEYAPLPS